MGGEERECNAADGAVALGGKSGCGAGMKDEEPGANGSAEKAPAVTAEVPIGEGAVPVVEEAVPFFRRRVVVVVSVVLMVAATVAGVAWMVRDYRQKKEWSQLQKKLPASGGRYVSDRVVIEMPGFRQGDARWSGDRLGPSDDTLGSAGCAVSSTAMVLAGYGVETDPQRLNDFLTANGGYTPQGWLKWEVAAEIAPERVGFVYENDASFKLIDDNVLGGNPVIVRLRYESGTTHFVVICGKEGYDYLVRDPGGRAGRGVYPLKEFGSDIEALRFYEKKS